MLEELTANTYAPRLPLSRTLDPLVKWGARQLLAWKPAGALLVELPSGARVRFGEATADDEVYLKLNSYRVLAKALKSGSIGFAEAYMDGDIDCPDLTALVGFFLRNRRQFERDGRGLFRSRLGDRLAHRLRRNSRDGSRRNIAAHYDLSNDFFRLWLDPQMIYSSGLYARGAGSLEDAQAAKLDLIVDVLDLSGGEDILEIGCGWGALARRAVINHGAKVTGITLSHEQLAHARNEASVQHLDGSCNFRHEDYRDVQGQFDRIVAVEMIEAVGEAYWPGFFRVLNERLRPGGSAVLQAITIDETQFDRYRRKADFIQRYIFPGGMLPTSGIIERQAEAAGLRLDRVELFGRCYARTLREWRWRFEAAWPQIARLGFDEPFRRRWRYYLAYCEAGFEAGAIDVGVYRLRKA